MKEWGLNTVRFYAENFADLLIKFLPNLLFTIVLLFAGLWLIKRFVKFLHQHLNRNSVDTSLSEFLISIVNVVLYVLLVICIASRLGIETTSFVAVLGAAGLAVGLALQGSLSNFAGGVLIILFKPFRVGHNITSSNNVSGTVLKIDILYTTLKAGNGTTIYAPNGPLANAVINNASDNEVRQAEYKISVSFTTNIDIARKVILSVLENDPLILKDPAPAVLVSSLGDSAIVLIIRAWTANSDFWPAYYANYQKLKEALEANAIELPSTATVVNVTTNPLP